MLRSEEGVPKLVGTHVQIGLLFKKKVYIFKLLVELHNKV